MKYLLCSLFCALQLSAQEVLFEGNVFDKTTKEPIPYVNLSFLNTLKGTSTDEAGYFYLDIPEAYLEKKVHISSLGYNDSIVTARSLYDSKRFEMIEESFELDEVVVSKDLGNSDVLNPISSYGLTSGFSSSTTPWVLALYFPNIGAQEKFVDKVTIFFQKNKLFKRSSSKFRIRIYDVHSVTKEPNNDLLRKSIVLESEVDKDFVTIDLSALQIKIPQTGIYIGLEWLFVAGNWYKYGFINPLTNEEAVEDRFAPTFGGVFNKNQNFTAMVYGMGEWTDFKVKSRDNSQNFIPAITLKISKE